MTDADRIDILQEEVRQLRTELRLEPARERVAALQLGLRLTPAEAVLVAVLYDARTWMHAERLNMALPDRDHANPRDLRTVKVHICRLRQKLPGDAVLGMRDRGYTLGADGVKACRRVLRSVGLDA